jgi:hypothetical protein
MYTRARLLLCLTLVALGGCTNHPTRPSELGAFQVRFVGNPNLGTAEKPLPFTANDPSKFTVDIDALTYVDGAWVVDDSWNGWAQIAVRPVGKLDGDPQVVQLRGGRARNVPVDIRMARGPVRLVITDPGYVPASDPSNAACNNAVDTDLDGFVGYPDDRGCFNSLDDDEVGGTASTGATPPIYFANPRIYDVVHPGVNMGDDSQMKGQRATVDRGVMLVTRVSTDGLFVTDFDGARWASNAWSLAVKDMVFRSVFSYNYSAPRNINEGDCLVQLDGTVQPFYGFTELSMPTWKKGDDAFCLGIAYNMGMTACTPNASSKTVQDCRINLGDLANTPFDLTTNLVDLPNGTQGSIWDSGGESFNSAKRFEAALVQISNADMFTELRVCDRNGNGAVDFSIAEEGDCSDACGDDPLCVVAETFNRYHQWKIHFTDGKGKVQAITVVSQGSIPEFDPIAAYNSYKGKTPKHLGKVVGTMRYLSFGRPPWTLEPRRPSDCPDCKQ